MDTSQILIIVLVFLCVANTIILVILLSYKNESFKHLIDNKFLQEKQLESIKQSISRMEIKIGELENGNSIHNILTVQEELKNSIVDVARQIESLSSELNKVAEKDISPRNEEDKKSEKQVVNMIAYNDAIIAFDNINRKFYKIRKYPNVVLGLANMLNFGLTDEKINFGDLPDEDKSYAANLQSDILMFNRNYRTNIVSYLHTEGLEWNDCVRNPYNKPFDNEWDENILGDEIQNGTIVTRIVQLGFEFPNSTKIGRTKSKTL